MKWVMSMNSLIFQSQEYKLLGSKEEIIEATLQDPYQTQVKNNKICIIIQIIAEGILLMKLTLLFNIMLSLTWK